MRKYFKLFGGLGAFALVAGLAIGAYAFTTSITVNGANSNKIDAGYGAGTEAGPFTASSIVHKVDSTDNNTITEVDFAISPSIATTDNVRLVLDGTAADYYTCSTEDGTNLVCVKGTTAVTLHDESSFQISVFQ